MNKKMNDSLRMFLVPTTMPKNGGGGGDVSQRKPSPGLDDAGHVEGRLQPLRELEGDQVPEVHALRGGATAGVEVEGLLTRAWLKLPVGEGGWTGMAVGKFCSM